MPVDRPAGDERVSRQPLAARLSPAAGTVDSFASAAIQTVLLGLLLVFSESSLSLDLPFPSGGARTLLWILAGVVVASVLVVLLVRRIRGVIVENVRRWWPDVRASLAALRASHKLALLVLGSLATELLFAIALGLFARSLGYDITIAELLVIDMSVSLLGSFVPVPGNIGVAEFGLTIGLVSAGDDPEGASGWPWRRHRLRHARPGDRRPDDRRDHGVDPQVITLVDANVPLDVLTGDPVWGERSGEAIAARGRRGTACHQHQRLRRGLGRVRADRGARRGPSAGDLHPPATPLGCRLSRGELLRPVPALGRRAPIATPRLLHRRP